MTSRAVNRSGSIILFTVIAVMNFTGLALATPKADEIATNIVLGWTNPETDQFISYKLTGEQFKTIQDMITAGESFNTAFKSIVMSDEYQAALAKK